jgi:hypothetical protein
VQEWLNSPFTHYLNRRKNDRLTRRSTTSRVPQRWSDVRAVCNCHSSSTEN